MRQSARSGAATPYVTAGSRDVTAGQRPPLCISVQLLDKEVVTVVVEPTMKTFQDIFAKTCECISLRETEFFGLAQLVDGEYHFVDLGTKLKTLKQRSWRSQSYEPSALRKLFFRVRFYVDNLQPLKERATRHQYYLQLRENLLSYAQLTNESKCFQLAAIALVADHGIYNPTEHPEHYFDPREYFPPWIVAKHGVDFLVQSMPAIHKGLEMSRVQAEMVFVKELSEVPQQHNLHFHLVQKKKVQTVSGATWLAIANNGVQIYEESHGFKTILATFLWNAIAKIGFDKKKIEIRVMGAPSGRKYAYYTGSESRSKYLLGLCRATHLFNITTLKLKLDEMKQFQNEDSRRFKESYIYSSNRGFNRPGASTNTSIASRASLAKERQILSRLTATTVALTTTETAVPHDLRVSLVSNTSSNTTSGICSEKMAVSFDESEDDRVGDKSEEIIINTPPCKSNNDRIPPRLKIIPFAHLPIASRNSVGVSSTPMTSPDGAKVSHTPDLSLTPISASPCQSEPHTPVGSPPLSMTSSAEPRAADAHIQRTTLAQAMIVKSTPVKGFAAIPASTVTSSPLAQSVTSPMTSTAAAAITAARTSTPARAGQHQATKSDTATPALTPITPGLCRSITMTSSPTERRSSTPLAVPRPYSMAIPPARQLYSLAPAGSDVVDGVAAVVTPPAPPPRQQAGLDASTTAVGEHTYVNWPPVRSNSTGNKAQLQQSAAAADNSQSSYLPPSYAAQPLRTVQPSAASPAFVSRMQQPSQLLTSPMMTSPPPRGAAGIPTAGANDSSWMHSAENLALRLKEDASHRRKSSYEAVVPAHTRPRRDPERRHTTDNYRIVPRSDVSAAVVAELEGLSDKHLSLPLLSALYNDPDLQKQCGWGQTTADRANQSVPATWSASSGDVSVMHDLQQGRTAPANSQNLSLTKQDFGTFKVRSSASIDSSNSSASTPSVASGYFGMNNNPVIGGVVNNNPSAALHKQAWIPTYQLPPVYQRQVVSPLASGAQPPPQHPHLSSSSFPLQQHPQRQPEAASYQLVPTPTFQPATALPTTAASAAAYMTSFGTPVRSPLSFASSQERLNASISLPGTSDAAMTSPSTHLLSGLSPQQPTVTDVLTSSYAVEGSYLHNVTSSPPPPAYDAAVTARSPAAAYQMSRLTNFTPDRSLLGASSLGIA